MTGPLRQRMRALVLLALGAAIVGVCVAFVRRDPSQEPRPALAPVHGWAAQGVRFSRAGRDGARLRVSARAVSTVPVRMGAFSIGFLQGIEASGVEVVLDLGTAREPHDLGFDLQEAIGAIAGPASRGKRFSRGAIDDLTLRVEAPGRGPLEIRAGRCDVRATKRPRLFLREHVVVRAGADEWRFARLVYEVAARRFTAEDETSPAELQAIASLNEAVRRLVDHAPEPSR